MRKILLPILICLFAVNGKADNGGNAAIGTGICGQIGYGDYTGAINGNVVVAASTTTATGTIEQFFSTATVSGFNLVNVGDSIQVECAFSTSPNSNTKRTRIEVNTTNALADTTAVASASIVQNARTTFSKSASNVQIYRGVASGATAANTNNTQGKTTLTDTNTMTFNCTCTDGTSSQGDCSFISMSVYQCGER